MPKKNYENVDSPIQEANIGDVNVDNNKPSLNDVLLSKAQVDLELIQLVVETHRMVKQLLDKNNGSG